MQSNCHEELLYQLSKMAHWHFSTGFSRKIATECHNSTSEKVSFLTWATHKYFSTGFSRKVAIDIHNQTSEVVSILT